MANLNRIFIAFIFIVLATETSFAAKIFMLCPDFGKGDYIHFNVGETTWANLENIARIQCKINDPKETQLFIFTNRFAAGERPNSETIIGRDLANKIKNADLIKLRKIN